MVVGFASRMGMCMCRTSWWCKGCKGERGEESFLHARRVVGSLKSFDHMHVTYFYQVRVVYHTIGTTG